MDLLELFNFGERPGNMFVVATLLPLLAFLISLLIGGVRAYFSRYRHTEGSGANIFAALGGDTPPPYAAWIGTGAMAIAFCLCFAGFLQHQWDAAALHSHHAAADHHPAAEKKDNHGKHEAKKDEHQHEAKKDEHQHAAHKIDPKELAEFQSRWNGSITWASITSNSYQDGQKSRFNDPNHATELRLGFHIDHLATLMFVMVTFIATLIHLFSIGYMSDERSRTVEDHEVHTDHGHLERRGRFNRFFLFLSLFCFSMLNLVLADNLFQVFLSWELVGICSYLLIGFYYERQSASNAANKAFITNRVGDAGFIIGLLILWTYVGTLNFEDMFQRLRCPAEDSHGQLAYNGQIVRGEPVPNETLAKVGRTELKVLGPKEATTWTTQAIIFPRKQSGHFHGAGPHTKKQGAEDHGENTEVYTSKSPTARQYSALPYWMLVLAGLGVFLGCVGKSAQFPLHVWLPDAMEGPTPVSALIHAATMVAAGVYLVGRCYPLFTPEALLVIAYTGGITLFVAATIAIVMTDIKKVLAYSTVSQLGYMMLALGIGGWVAGLFHLVTHAFFKALLFLCSGSVIYGCHHVQEMGKMGGLYPKMKITALTMLMGVLAIAGTPLFTGWYSKDAIMAQALGYAMVHQEHALLLILPLLTAGITTFYMFRMWYMTFTGPPKDEHVHEHARESPWIMTVPLILLALCSIGAAWGWPVWDAEASAMEHHVHHAQHNSVLADFGHGPENPAETGVPVKPHAVSERHLAHEMHAGAGALAMIVVIIGFAFATAIYYFRVFDPADAKEQVAPLHNFLTRKWYFDELYSALLVRPAVQLGQWCKRFDLGIIDGFLHLIAHTAIWLSWLGGAFDRYVIDGLVNLIGRVTTSSGNWLRHVQTGSLRSYVLFLVLAAVGLWVLLSAFLLPAAAGK